MKLSALISKLQGELASCGDMTVMLALGVDTGDGTVCAVPMPHEFEHWGDGPDKRPHTIVIGWPPRPMRFEPQQEIQ